MERTMSHCELCLTEVEDEIHVSPPKKLGGSLVDGELKTPIYTVCEECAEKISSTSPDWTFLGG